MPDSTEKDFGEFLATQLGKPEPQAPYPPHRHADAHTDTHTHSHLFAENQTHGHREEHTLTDAHTGTDIYRHKDTNSPKQSLCATKWSYLLQRELIP